MAGDGAHQRLRRRADDPRAIDAAQERKGHLLLTSSVAGRRALPGSLYSATKYAVTAMGEAARQELNGTGVRVTLIEPGMVDTPFFDNPPQIERAEADDIARAVMFAVAASRRTSTSTRSWSARRRSRAEREPRRGVGSRAIAREHDVGATRRVTAGRPR